MMETEMTHDKIRERLAKLHERLGDLSRRRERVNLLIKQTREMCDHSDRKRWTNNDGDGQFFVERCNICGLQKDGGLGT